MEAQQKQNSRAVDKIDDACGTQRVAYITPQGKDFPVGSKRSKINCFLNIA